MANTLILIYSFFMKMKQVIFINGPINSGKSTIARILANTIDGGFYIEGDTIIPDRPASFDEWISTTIEKAINLAVELIAQNKMPIIAFPLRDQDWMIISERFNANNIQSFCITLSPKLEIALSTRNERHLENWEKERIQEMYQDGFQARQFSSLILDNSNEDPFETTKKILTFLRSN